METTQGGGGANVAQADSAATDDDGETCIRFYFRGVTRGKATWEGISLEIVDKHGRLKSEGQEITEIAPDSARGRRSHHKSTHQEEKPPNRRTTG
jgi:hypothetical protein